MPLRALMPLREDEPQAGDEYDEAGGQNSAEQGLPKDDAGDQVEIKRNTEHQRNKSGQQ